FQYQVQSTQGSLDSSFIAIVKNGNIFSEPPDQPDLLYGQRSSGRSYDILNSRSVQGNDIRITFHQKAYILLSYFVPGLKNPVQNLSLMIYVSFRGIQIFGSVFGFIGFQDPGTKSDYFPGHIMYRKDHPSPETVIPFRLSVIFPDDQTSFFKQFRRVPFRSSFF